MIATHMHNAMVVKRALQQEMEEKHPELRGRMQEQQDKEEKKKEEKEKKK
jgi:hypothetical protein